MKHVIPPYHERIVFQEKYDDFFNRRPFADNLTNLLKETDDSLTITINAEWGEGKTTFIKLWEKELKEDNRFIPIYFDAFENDFANDAFISIAVTIQEAIQKYYEKLGFNYNREQLFKEYKEAAKELGMELSIMGAGKAIKYATGGIFEADSLLELIAGKAKELDKRSNKALINDKYDAFLNRRDLIAEYHESLNKLLTKSNKSHDQKIIFFIDELDRCRPNYAVQVIEKIKHLFSAPRVNFVMAINRDQLTQIIKNAYGLEGDGDALMYLQKFVHVETRLPSLRGLGGETDKLRNFIIDLIDEYGFETFNTSVFLQIINKTLPHFPYTPRSVERTLTLYAISIGSTSQVDREELDNHILLLSILKIHAPKAFQELKNNGRLTKTGTHRDNTATVIPSSLIDYLKTEKFLPTEFTQGSASNTAKIDGITRAVRIVDMYDLPPRKINKSDSLSSFDDDYSETPKGSRASNDQEDSI